MPLFPHAHTCITVAICSHCGESLEICYILKCVICDNLGKSRYRRHEVTFEVTFNDQLFYFLVHDTLRIISYFLFDIFDTLRHDLLPKPLQSCTELLFMIPRINAGTLQSQDALCRCVWSNSCCR